MEILIIALIFGSVATPMAVHQAEKIDAKEGVSEMVQALGDRQPAKVRKKK